MTVDRIPPARPPTSVEGQAVGIRSGDRPAGARASGPRHSPSPRLSRRHGLRAIALLLAGGLLSARPGRVAAEAIEMSNIRLEPTFEADGWALSADFTVPLSSRVEESVNRGVVLYFVIEFELFRPRWYWWDDRLVQTSQTYRLSYHALTRQYRLALNGYLQHFSNLEDAVRSMTRLRGWKVVGADQVSAGGHYDAFLRMRLDVSQLPKPFQVTAITNRDWNLQAEWKRFVFTPGTPTSDR